MRTQSNKYGTFNYPDKWCFASNEQYIEVSESTLTGALELAVTDTARPREVYHLDVMLLNGKGKVQIGRVLSALFSDNISSRCIYAHFAFGRKKAHLLSFHCYVLRGNMELNEYFSSFGNFSVEDGKSYYRHRLVWFVNYPFTVTVFRRHTGEDITYRLDGQTIKKYNATGINYVEIDAKSIAPNGMHRGKIYTLKYAKSLALFDKTFDKTFIEQYGSMINEEIDILTNKRSEGYYLRWLDSFGQILYYLFDKMDARITTHSSEYSAYDDINQYGDRPLSRTVIIERKASAINLPRDIQKYVSTISLSPYIELYQYGRWVPVRVETTSTVPRKDILSNFEIIIKTKNNIQTLA